MSGLFKKSLLSLLVSFSLFTASERLARADVAPSEPGCESLSDEGQSCTNGGTCTKTKCERLDYANWDRDASAAPPTIQVDCLRCVDKNGNNTDSDDTAEARRSSDGTGTGAADDANDKPAGPLQRTATSPEASDDGGCSITHRTARDVGPWLLALVVPALILGTRKRRAAK